jgi:hypothetical protein
MSWTKEDFCPHWPDAPNPYSSSDEPRRGGALVDEAKMLDAMAAHERLMADCKCDWDIDDEGRGVNTPPAGGCPVADHNPDDENHASDCAHWAGEPCDCITGKDPK